MTIMLNHPSVIGRQASRVKLQKWYNLSRGLREVGMVSEMGKLLVERRYGKIDTLNDEMPD
jgi:hypothetical protein